MDDCFSAAFNVHMYFFHSLCLSLFSFLPPFFNSCLEPLLTLFPTIVCDVRENKKSWAWDIFAYFYHNTCGYLWSNCPYEWTLLLFSLHNEVIISMNNVFIFMTVSIAIDNNTIYFYENYWLEMKFCSIWCVIIWMNAIEVGGFSINFLYNALYFDNFKRISP